MLAFHKPCGLIGKPKVQSALAHEFIRAFLPSDLALICERFRRCKKSWSPASPHFSYFHQLIIQLLKQNTDKAHYICLEQRYKELSVVVHSLQEILDCIEVFSEMLV